MSGPGDPPAREPPATLLTAAAIAKVQLGLLSLGGAYFALVLWRSGLRWLSFTVLLDVVVSVVGLECIAYVLRGSNKARRILEGVLVLRAVTPVASVLSLWVQALASVLLQMLQFRATTLSRTILGICVLSLPALAALRGLEAAEVRDWFGQRSSGR